MTDPGIILFGKKIGLPEAPNNFITDDAVAVHDQQKDESDEEGMSENTPATNGDSMNLQTRTLKKPDKILPCPRCDSMNTKFCYFNNSNVNQPRHFCKSCQRYWTAGGTMRNMPVGAGRRKKKTTPSQIELAPDSRDDCSSSSVVEKMQENNGFNSHFHWLPGAASWPYNPWNTQLPIPIPVPVPVPVPPPGYPQIPMCPSPYWNSVSWLPPSTSVLGKHPTDEEAIAPEELKKQKNSILIPKTLRIHDPDEAAKSSIWATLGIKNEHSGRGDLFKGFQSKENDKKKYKATEPSPVLQANPAAFSRSLSFQERA
ncbi:hypothetical protein QVD17_25344 [Tagetes erecta]|uniref:Dof-type domain-containing protein n=1 Tax=Tagetes erecta TaxID=13708 RepID=A0AAD8KJ30_TARER|nr:hypothetical protein QVD17_25344 [Tagetes erecta]